MKEDCKLIEIKQKIPGFDHFIGSWVYRGDISFVVDVGPANSVGQLIQTLLEMKMERVDYVLLTHIHIDHAGGLGQFLEHFPMARVVCHDRGIRHLVNPSKLWEGTRLVLGEIAEAFGPFRPVREEVCIPHTQAAIEELIVVETPGHAPHHISFSYRANLFVGEAGGNYYAIQDKDYLRPATPPKFYLNVFLESLDRLGALENQHICYAHFGDAPDSGRMLNRFRGQILRWKEVIEREIAAGSDDLLPRCLNRLLEEDPNLAAFGLMDADTRGRERFFMTNSIKGFIEFIQNAG